MISTVVYLLIRHSCSDV